jgi:hypothetical protein
LFESLESIDPLGELSFVINGTAGAPAILTFALALLAESSSAAARRSGVRRSPLSSPSSLLRPGKPFIFLLAGKPWAGSRLSSAAMRIVGRTSRLDSNSPVEPART